MKITAASEPPRLVLWRVVEKGGEKIVVAQDETGALRFSAFVTGRKPSACLSPWKRKWPQARFMENKAKGSLGASASLSGTPFQISVWRAIATIREGAVLTYAELARKAGHPSAARAVGSACGANPLPLLIPCHRIIGTNNRLGGFSAPLKIKLRLLRREGHAIN
jgi:O-6-methylguanine DNA methyltransferase